jgi:hypothetical protein
MLKRLWTYDGGYAALVAAIVVIGFAAEGRAQGVRPQSTADRLQALEDYVEIERLLMRYAAALNTGDTRSETE